MAFKNAVPFSVYLLIDANFFIQNYFTSIVAMSLHESHDTG
jgi:hypothetical protein